jgi:HSP20 family protein
MALTFWSNFDDQFRWSEDLFRSFAPFFGARASRSPGVFPAVNIYDNGESFMLRAELPGVDKESLELSVKGDELTLRGERKIEAAGPQANYHRRECAGGKFRRVVQLPQPVAADKISASFKNGVLEVVLPRVPEAQPRTISVH